MNAWLLVLAAAHAAAGFALAYNPRGHGHAVPPAAAAGAVAATTAWLVLIGLGLVLRRRRQRAPRGAIVAGVIASLAPHLYVLASRSVAKHLIQFWSCVYRGPSFWPVLCAAALGGAIAATTAQAGTEGRSARLVAGVSAATVAMALVGLLLAATPRVLLPEPSRYIASLPEVGTLPPVAGPPTRMDPGLPWTWRENEIHETVLGGTDLVTRVCQTHFCGLVMGDVRRGSGLWGARWESFLASKPIIMRRDAVLDLWVAEQGNIRRAVREGRDTELSFSDVAPLTSPPSTWIALAVVGLFAVAILSVAARSSDRTRRRIEGGLPATLRDDGWLEMHDDLPPRRGPAGLLPAGPVVLLSASDRAWTETGVYRGASDRDDVVLRGERSALAASAGARATMLRLLASGVGILTAAPLIAALRLGLLGLGR